MKKTLITGSFLSFMLLGGCSSNGITGEWEKDKQEFKQCIDNVEKLTFTKDDTVQGTKSHRPGYSLGGTVKKINANAFSIQFTNGVAADITIEKKDGKTLMHINDNEGYECKFYKKTN